MKEDIEVQSEFVVVREVASDKTVVNNVLTRSRIETTQELEHTTELNEIPSSMMPPLPKQGEECIRDVMYAYNDETILCIQTHARTIYPPEDTPALFSFYRENSDTLEWQAGEIVEVGWIRVYLDKSYEVLQQHQTQEGWEPDKVPALWKLVDTGGDECLAWVKPTGAHDAYNTGDCALFDDVAYLSTYDGNVYSLTEYPAGWELKV